MLATTDTKTAQTDGASPGIDDLDWHQTAQPDAHWRSAAEAFCEVQTQFTVAQWADAVRAARCADARVMVVMHLFAGPRRRGDVQERVEHRAALLGLKILMVSVDLLVDAAWNL